MLGPQTPLEISSTKFTLEISGCDAAVKNGERAKVVINFDAESSVTLELSEHGLICFCGCPARLINPPAPYNLKDCPSPIFQRKIFAWDCETSFEAKNEAEAIAHDSTVSGRVYPNTYLSSITNDLNPNRLDNNPWVGGCSKCIECSGTGLGTRTISIATTAKACHPCGPEVSTAICNGGLRSEAPRAVSNPFYGACLVNYDAYAKVNGTFDNWGYVKDAYGTATTSGCSNENTDNCEICQIYEQVIGPLKAVQAGPDFNPPEEGMQQVGVDSWVINSPHGGPNSIAATVEFYFEPKPKP